MNTRTPDQLDIVTLEFVQWRNNCPKKVRSLFTFQKWLSHYPMDIWAL